MRSRLPFLSILLAGATLVALPHLAHATSLPYWGPIVPPGASTCPAAWGSVIQLINNVIAFGLTIVLSVVSPIMFAYIGFLYMTSGENPSNRSNAKSMMQNLIIGIVLALAGYLMVDSLLTALTTNSLAGWTNQLFSSNVSSCLQVSSSLSQTSGASGTPGSGLTPSGTTPGNTGGSCATPTSGPCSVSNLQNSCFGSNATQAAEICMNESGGNPANQSGVDKTSDGHSYSVGLFQTNLSNSFSPPVDGQSCAAAFSQPCQNSGGFHNVASNGTCSSTVVNLTLYNDCVAAAQDAQTGVTVGCSLSSNGSNWGRWQNTEQGLQSKGCSGF